MRRQEIQYFGEVFNGKTPSKEEQRSGGRPILKIRDIDETGQFRGVFESFVDDAFYNRHAKKKLKTGDIIILNAAHNSDYVGSKNAFVTDELNEVIATGEWLIVRVREADSKYVNHYLKSPSGRKALKNCVKGIHLYPKDVERISIPFPILDDQKRIAHLLGKVEGLIAQRKQHLQQLDDLLKSVFLEMFGDPVRNEQGWDVHVMDSISDSRLGKMRDKKFITGAHLKKYLGNSNVQWFRFIFDELLEMDFDERERKIFKLEYGDLLVCEGGEIGRCAIWKNQIDDCYFQKALHRVRLDQNKTIPEYIQYVFLFYSLSNGFKITSKATIAHLTGEKLKAIYVPLPPINLQNQFATIVEKVESLKFRYQQSLTDLEALYGALSQKAFKGELDLSRVPLV